MFVTQLLKERATANTDDLRYVRTEGAIRDAFMGLAAERPLSEALPHLEELQAAAIEASAAYLMKEGQELSG